MRHKDRSLKIVAQLPVLGVFGVLLICALYVLFSYDRAGRSAWYGDVAAIYLQKSSDEPDAKKAHDYVRAAQMSQALALRERPLDPQLWHTLSGYYTRLGEPEKALRAQQISSGLRRAEILKNMEEYP